MRRPTQHSALSTQHSPAAGGPRLALLGGRDCRRRRAASAVRRERRRVKEVVQVSKRLIFIVLVLVTALAAVPVFAGPVPSKTAANQSLDQRAADIAVVRDVISHDEVAKALEARGFTRAQVDQKLAQLSPQDLHQLAQNLDQLQAAGLTRQEWYWIGIGALAVIILLVALAAVPVFAGPVPSKTAANQSLDQRAADIAVVRDVLSHDEVAKALEARGFTRQQVDQKLAQLSPQDLHQLAQNLDQLQAAGLTSQEWLWVALGAIAALVQILR